MDKLRINPSVLAKTKDNASLPKPGDMYPATGVKWDDNWDRRDPKSLVKPLKDNATDEEKAAYEEKLVANTSKASRVMVLVRHGQYNLSGKVKLGEQLFGGES